MAPFPFSLFHDKSVFITFALFHLYNSLVLYLDFTINSLLKATQQHIQAAFQQVLKYATVQPFNPPQINES
jgi:hypothetical protein